MRDKREDREIVDFHYSNYFFYFLILQYNDIIGSSPFNPLKPPKYPSLLFQVYSLLQMCACTQNRYTHIHITEAGAEGL